jgi:hypothetical protein
MADDLRDLVEKIVAQVLSRLEQDAEFSELLQKKKSAGNAAPQWVKTCTSYRGGDALEKKSLVVTTPAAKRLYTERDILDLIKQGQKELVVDKKTILTPAARDAAAQKGIVIRVGAALAAAQ